MKLGGAPKGERQSTFIKKRDTEEKADPSKTAQRMEKEKAAKRQFFGMFAASEAKQTCNTLQKGQQSSPTLNDERPFNEGLTSSTATETHAEVTPLLASGFSAADLDGMIAEDRRANVQDGDLIAFTTVFYNSDAYQVGLLQMYGERESCLLVNVCKVPMTHWLLGRTGCIPSSVCEVA